MKATPNITSLYVVYRPKQLKVPFFFVGFPTLSLNGALLSTGHRTRAAVSTTSRFRKQRAMRAHLAKMSLLFQEADTSGDGRLDLEAGCFVC